MTINVNYATVYLKYPGPTPITGEPTNKSIKQIKQELRDNSSSVVTDLGGGDYGYLGLYLPNVEYTWIAPTLTPFVAPAWSRALAIDSAATAVQVVY